MRICVFRFVFFIVLVFLFVIVGVVFVVDKSWIKKFFDVKGSWSVVEQGGKFWIVLVDDFFIKKVFDFKFFFFKKSGVEFNGKNVVDGVFIVKFEFYKGGQCYEIFVNVDFSQFVMFVLYCEKYLKFWVVFLLF